VNVNLFTAKLVEQLGDDYNLQLQFDCSTTYVTTVGLPLAHFNMVTYLLTDLLTYLLTCARAAEPRPKSIGQLDCGSAAHNVLRHCDPNDR